MTCRDRSGSLPRPAHAVDENGHEAALLALLVHLRPALGHRRIPGIRNLQNSPGSWLNLLCSNCRNYILPPKSKAWSSYKEPFDSQVTEYVFSHMKKSSYL